MSVLNDGGPRKARRRAARDLLIRTSTVMFRERGFDETTLGAIAAEAGTTVPTVLTHFPSKEHLALSWEFDTLSGFAEKVAEAGPEIPTLELWREVAQEVITLNPEAFAAFAKRWVWIAATPSLHRAVLLLARDYADVLENSFRADLGSRVRHLSARLSARTVANSLAFSNFAMLLQWGQEGAPDDIQLRVEQVISLIERLVDSGVGHE